MNLRLDGGLRKTNARESRSLRQQDSPRVTCGGIVGFERSDQMGETQENGKRMPQYSFSVVLVSVLLPAYCFICVNNTNLDALCDPFNQRYIH